MRKRVHPLLNKADRRDRGVSTERGRPGTERGHGSYVLRLRQNVGGGQGDSQQQQGSANEELPRIWSTGLPGSKMTGRLMQQHEWKGTGAEGCMCGRT